MEECKAEKLVLNKIKKILFNWFNNTFEGRTHSLYIDKNILHLTSCAYAVKIILKWVFFNHPANGVLVLQFKNSSGWI
jgi:hypothetical protein